MPASGSALSCHHSINGKRTTQTVIYYLFFFNHVLMFKNQNTIKLQNLKLIKHQLQIFRYMST